MRVPTRNRSVSVLATTSVVLMFAVVGCWSPAPATAPAQPTAAAKTTAAPDDSKLLADWPRPAAALLISGQLDGYLEPCGCTEGQRGGLARRGDLIQRLKAQGYELGAIDLGGIVRDPNGARGGLDQAKVKFGVGLRALALMNYGAMGVSVEDLKLGVVETLTTLTNRTGSFAIVSANVATTPALGIEGTIVPKVVIPAGPAKFGVTAVLDPSEWANLKDQEKDLFVKVEDPAKTLGPTLETLKGESDVQVLMVQGPIESAKALAERFPDFDLVVAASLHADPDAEPIPLNGGKTLMVQVGRKGTYAGLVGYYPNASPAFRYQRVTLNRKYKDDPGIRNLLDQEYLGELKSLRIVEDFKRHAPSDAPAGATFVGAQTCQACHPGAYNKWASSKHAHAFDSLVADPKRDRRYDAECVTCHTTGFGLISGWVSTEETPYLKGNQCENCHGPGSKHAAEPDNLEFRKAMARKAEDVEKNHFCMKCHDEDNSPHFKWEEYWPKIKHTDMDTYADPAVHKGVVPKVAGRAN